jgi:hypothetical protein
MVKKLLILIVFSALGIAVLKNSLPGKNTNVADITPDALEEYTDYLNWKRPDGPPKVGIQVGHWKNEEVPEELHRLKGSTGASGGGMSEWEVNYQIASELKVLLEEKGIKAELLPTTIPPKYWADVFISIHADGNPDPAKSGFKAAKPRRDISGKAEKLLEEIEQDYGNLTGLSKDPNVTRNMLGYYAFRWWRYDHAIHPMTPAVILETGFLSSPSDRKLIVDNPKLSARAISLGIIDFLRSENLLKG